MFHVFKLSRLFCWREFSRAPLYHGWSRNLTKHSWCVASSIKSPSSVKLYVRMRLCMVLYFYSFRNRTARTSASGGGHKNLDKANHHAMSNLDLAPKRKRGHQAWCSKFWSVKTMKGNQHQRRLKSAHRTGRYGKWIGLVSYLEILQECQKSLETWIHVFHGVSAYNGRFSASKCTLFHGQLFYPKNNAECIFMSGPSNYRASASGLNRAPWRNHRW